MGGNKMAGGKMWFAYGHVRTYGSACFFLALPKRFPGEEEEEKQKTNNKTKTSNL